MIRALYVEPAARPVTLQERAVLFFVVRTVFHVKSNMVYTLCKHMVYMLSITNEHKNELEIRAKPEWKVHFLCFASAKRGSFSIR